VVRTRTETVGAFFIACLDSSVSKVRISVVRDAVLHVGLKPARDLNGGLPLVSARGTPAGRTSLRGRHGNEMETLHIPAAS
ncbi:MAG: hypothetical protein ACLQDI_19195, partial [Syntrophobacteraceae bacterium]